MVSLGAASTQAACEYTEGTPWGLPVDAEVGAGGGEVMHLASPDPGKSLAGTAVPRVSWSFCDFRVVRIKDQGCHLCLSLDLV